jgi:hypothetical protein
MYRVSPSIHSTTQPAERNGKQPRVDQFLFLETAGIHDALCNVFPTVALPTRWFHLTGSNSEGYLIRAAPHSGQVCGDGGVSEHWHPSMAGRIPRHRSRSAGWPCWQPWLAWHERPVARMADSLFPVARFQVPNRRFYQGCFCCATAWSLQGPPWWHGMARCSRLLIMAPCLCQRPGGLRGSGQQRPRISSLSAVLPALS